MGIPTLSDREMRVSALVAEGYSNRDIAVQLDLGEQTVKNVIHSLFDKLGVWNRVETCESANGRQFERRNAANAGADRAATPC